MTDIANVVAALHGKTSDVAAGVLGLLQCLSVHDAQPCAENVRPRPAACCGPRRRRLAQGCAQTESDELVRSTYGDLHEAAVPRPRVTKEVSLRALRGSDRE